MSLKKIISLYFSFYHLPGKVKLSTVLSFVCGVILICLGCFVGPPSDPLILGIAQDPLFHFYHSVCSFSLWAHSFWWWKFQLLTSMMAFKTIFIQTDHFIFIKSKTQPIFVCHTHLPNYLRLFISFSLWDFLSDILLSVL